MSTPEIPPSQPAAPTGSPVRLEATYPEQLSRGLWLVKWLLLIPHFVVLLFLWVAVVVLTLVAFVAILVTGRYPRGIFDFNLGVVRWTWRVSFYSYSALGTDQYPPFTLAEQADYPTRIDIAYPEHLSRGLALVKWFLAIPHYLVLTIFLGAGWTSASDHNDDWLWSGGLLSLLVLVVGLALLFTGRYPRGIFDFIMGINRWAFRVGAYVGLMTDTYPPFRLDTGEHEH